MNKIHVSTISLSSRTTGDLLRQLEELEQKTKGDGRIYEVGDVYEATPGYMAVDIFVFVDSKTAQAFKAIEEFESEENQGGKVH